MAGTAPALPDIFLSDDLVTLVERLRTNMMLDSYHLTLLDSYYNGNQIIRDLGISLPPQMRGLNTVVGWAAMAVDAIEERLDVKGFRYPGSTTVDDELQAIWQDNDLDEESPLAHIDALTLGRSFISVGTPGEGDDSSEGVIVRVDSPLDMHVEWDPRTRSVQAALRLVHPLPLRVALPTEATLYLPNETIRLEQAYGGGAWEILERDQHNLGRVPVVRMVNRQRPHNRFGASEITSPVMSVIDAACRTLMSMEVAREFFAAPQRYILGANESAFQNADGTAKSAWQTYIGRILALEPADNGDGSTTLPQVGEFRANDPKSYTEIIDAYAKLMAGQTGLPLHYFGYTTDNPASADAIAYSEWRLKKRAERRTTHFGGAWEQAMRLALMVRDGVDSLPTEAHRLSTSWAPTDIPKVAAKTDSILKQVQMGAISPRADVVLEELGWDAAQREQLRAAMKDDQAEAFLNEVAGNIATKAIRLDDTVARDAANPLSDSGNGSGTPPASR